MVIEGLGVTTEELSAASYRAARFYQGWWVTQWRKGYLTPARDGVPLSPQVERDDARWQRTRDKGAHPKKIYAIQIRKQTKSGSMTYWAKVSREIKACTLQELFDFVEALRKCHHDCGCLKAVHMSRRAKRGFLWTLN
jgi:hypothetical protein